MRGVMSDSIDWDMLQEQYLTNPYYCDILSKECEIVDNPLESSLSRIPGYVFNPELKDLDADKLKHITPYDVLNLMNSVTNCPDVSYIRQEQYNKADTKEKTENLIIEYPYSYSKKALDQKKRNKEAIWFMRGMMDECTHLKNFSVPFDTSLIIAVCAESDGYVPKTGVSTLQDIWPGATVKIVNTGHVGAYIWHLKVFRESIVEAFERAKKVVPPPLVEIYEV